MRPIRFTIAGLMGLVLVAGVIHLALLRADPFWASLAQTVAFGVVLFAVLASVVVPSGPDRAGWIGAALFGGVYVGISFIPPFETAIRPHLFTSHVLAYIHPKLGYGNESGYYLWPSYNSEPYNSEKAEISIVHRSGKTVIAKASVINWGDNREYFDRLCHSLFGMLSALAGRLLGCAIWMTSRRSNRGAQQPSAS